MDKFSLSGRVARRLDRLQLLADKLTADGHRALAVRADITDEDDCRRLAGAAVTAFGRLDILVNNAGIGSIRPAHRQTSAVLFLASDASAYVTGQMIVVDGGFVIT